MKCWNSEHATTFDQSSVVPFRQSFDSVEFCLITSMSGRWGFPKGLIDPGETFVETAIREAIEEAGLHGRLVGTPLGTYEVFKYGRMNTVAVSLMEVTRCDDVWEEDHRRERIWVTADLARHLLCRSWLRTCFDAAVGRIEQSLPDTSNIGLRFCETQAAV